MKSLEIVNEKIDYIEISKNNIKEVSPYYYEKVLLKQLNELYQIKADLEVLEIIKKKKVDVNDVYICDRYELYIVYMKNLKIAEESIITLEEFNKLKQWLEEQE